MTDKLKATIEASDKIIILGHRNLDGDCLGSQQALGFVLRNRYPDKKIYTPFKVEEAEALLF